MNKLRISLIALVLTVILAGTLGITGCSEPHPDIIIGTWKEADYSRGIVFKENGDCMFVDLDEQLHSVPGALEPGKWPVKS